MAVANVRITTELKSPSELGTYHRFVCMTGPNKGKVYYLNGRRIILGRGERADIQIVDPKISREHAEISMVDNGYVITDLSNQNGIIINDKKVTQKRLADGEKIVIGQTVIKYNFIEVSEAKNELVEVEDNVVAINSKEIKKTQAKPKMTFKAAAADDDDEPYTAPKKEPKNNKVIVLVIVLGAIIYITMGGDEPKRGNTIKKGSAIDEFELESKNSGKKSVKEEPEVRKKFDMLIHSGRREFREGNYFRAMEEFRRADLVIPNSGVAGYLMSRAKQHLDEDVTKNFDKANRDLDAKKYQSAIISLCGVMQLLQNYPDDERYKNADEKLRAIEIELAMEKGEIRCFEEKPADSKN